MKLLLLCDRLDDTAFTYRCAHWASCAITAKDAECFSHACTAEAADNVRRVGNFPVLVQRAALFTAIEPNGVLIPAVQV